MAISGIRNFRQLLYIKKNKETVKFPRRTCARFSGPLFRKIPHISANWSGLSPFYISSGPLTQTCSGYPDHNPENILLLGPISRIIPGKIAVIHHFLEIFRIFREPFSRSIPNISGNIIVEVSGLFRQSGLECSYRNIPDISEKWSGF